MFMFLSSQPKSLYKYINNKYSMSKTQIYLNIFQLKNIFAAVMDI